MRESRRGQIPRVQPALPVDNKRTVAEAVLEATGILGAEQVSRILQILYSSVGHYLLAAKQIRFRSNELLAVASPGGDLLIFARKDEEVALKYQLTSTAPCVT